MPTAQPYGSWLSPITADLIVAQSIGLSQLGVDAGDIYWLEQRPTEGGRNVLVRYTSGTYQEITPAPFNVRSKVHEYGGAAYIVAGGQVYFVNFADQQIYTQTLVPEPSPPQRLTEIERLRYANGVVDQTRERLIWVCEDHRQPDREPINTLVSFPMGGGESRILASGADFYAAPSLSPDGNTLAWLTWNHPQMPWDGSQLWVAPIQADGSLGTAQLVAGSPTESICQPSWLPDGSLVFASDRSDWWNLYRWFPQTEQQVPLYPMAAEFGWPHWVFGRPTYAPCVDTEGNVDLICTYNQQNLWQLGRLSLKTGEWQTIPSPDTEISDLNVTPTKIVYLGGSASQPSAVVSIDLAKQARKILWESSPLNFDLGYLSQPQAVEFPTAAEQTAYAWFYPPQNADYHGLPGERPPLLVRSHGGPTAASGSGFNLGIQFWTSRGFAILDVNYGGSTGYGREYRQRLQGQWGIVDVVDCLNAAQYAVAQGWVDGDRLAIRGSSAGGYTTLAALTFHNVFKAGASYYGVSDIEILAKDTHKFEARYLDGLIGPYPAAQSLYQERSPIYAADQLNCPVIFFQGLEDKVVPPNQAELMVDSLTERGVPVAYLAFAGEQHGFRQAETIVATLQAEWSFYAQIFGIPLIENLLPVAIRNWPKP